MFDTAQDKIPPRAVLVSIQPSGVSDEDLAGSLDELRRLAKTLGLDVADRVTQKRDRPDSATYLGPGKVEELAAVVAEGRAVAAAEGRAAAAAGGHAAAAAEGRAAAAAAEERAAAAGDGEPDDEGTPDAGDDGGDDGTPRRRWVVVVDEEISPSQARNLAKATKAEVMDRTALILEIFHRHATSRAARAQVEIVRLAYLAPRLRESRKGGAERQQGGIGGKGSGEAAVELDRRRLRDRIAELRAELERIDQDRQTRRARRQDLRRVALVGYTNAGKSTLMRALTGSEVYVADKLFATLDTTVRALHPPVEPRILVSDTVGFIKKLPHGLVASFKSTLDEALEASLLLHLVDASDPAFERHMETTHAVLAEIGAGDIPTQLVLNKCDRVDDPALLEALAARFPDALLVSAKDPADVDRVRASIHAAIDGALEEAEVVVPHRLPAVRANLFATCSVLAETYDEHGGTYRVRAHPGVLARIRAAMA